MVETEIQKITSLYGQRGKIFHAGIDLRTWNIKFWKPLRILFPEPCEVLRTWVDDWGGGIALKPLNNTQFDELKFIHVEISPALTVGDVFAKGTLIGYSMLSKLNKSHHLHFEVWVDKKTVNPILYIEAAGYKYE